jgi:F0F1-type ATP synthase assembly protein I
MALSFGLELAVMVGASAYIGSLLDKYYSTQVFVITLTILAFIGGMLRLYFGLKKYL